LAEAFRDVSFVEFDHESRVRTQFITEENQKGDGLLVDKDGAFAVESLNDHVLTNGTKTVEYKVVRVHREETFGSPI